jgi:RNA exonuclease 1
MGKGKRKYSEFKRDESRGGNFGLGGTLALLRDETQAQNGPKAGQKADDGDSWTVVESKKARKRRVTQNLPPKIYHSPTARLQSHLKISDLQGLVLYLLTNGTAPQWIAVQNIAKIRPVVVLMVPGLDMQMFRVSNASEAITTAPQVATNSDLVDEPKDLENEASSKTPDSFYPIALDHEKLPGQLKQLAPIFGHVWPIKTNGDDKFLRLRSAIQSFLMSSLPKDKVSNPQKGYANKPTPITEYIATLEDLQESDFPLHPALMNSAQERTALLSKRKSLHQTSEDGWVDSNVEKLEDGDVPDSEIESGSLTAGREILTIDCEMCKTDDVTHELTRISAIRWDGSIVLDELVKPSKPIVDYLTQYVLAISLPPIY